jgi:hypothetical protein
MTMVGLLEHISMYAAVLGFLNGTNMEVEHGMQGLKKDFK